MPQPWLCCTSHNRVRFIAIHEFAKNKYQVWTATELASPAAALAWTNTQQQHHYYWSPAAPAHCFKNSSVHCFCVSSGLVTVWPTVFSDEKISWSLPPCTSHTSHAWLGIQPRQSLLAADTVQKLPVLQLPGPFCAVHRTDCCKSRRGNPASNALQLLRNTGCNCYATAATYREGLVTEEVDLIKVLLNKLQAVGLIPALQGKHTPQP